MSTPLEIEHCTAFPLPPRENIPRSRVLPPIVRIVLTQAELRRRHGGITEGTFAAQLQRLEREELVPRGLELKVRTLSSGATRFLVKGKTTGAIFDLIDCPAD